MFTSDHEIKHQLDKNENWPKFPTSIPLVDFITEGGIPKGRVTLCFGPPSSGKSTVFMQAAASVQREGKYVVWIDAEGAFVAKYARQLGIDTEDTETFRVARSPSLEKTIDFVVTLVQHPKVGMVVIDSIAYLMLESEIANGGDSNQVGGISKKLKLGVKLIQNTMDAVGSEAAICLVAQQYDAIGVYSPGGGTPKKVGGGTAVMHAASLALEFKPVGWVKGKEHDMVTGELTEKDVNVGQRIRCKVFKTRMTEPGRETQFVFIKDRGIDDVFSMVELATIRKVIPKRPGKSTWFDVPAKYTNTGEEKPCNGQAQLRQHFYDNPDLYSRLESDILSLIEEGANDTVEVIDRDSSDRGEPNIVDLTEED
jgi:recombination protein RecA